ncbi:iron complex transport system permease protein [Actinokineospora alba]|uniref:Iron complex transport system permease protein n=1 Tax=Actinokineospora alba TaxID=504798 RepID=A0A1H0MXF9_9PSEU|nr:iron ABC transporter permease [Actinokineospora alba]TDP68476.1 iron complex transport system permease protein [Actinokineospora alba]SDH79847.1 iron complex transport system permease protein [Actinokineospora alba]SDO85158.1 iron complex transport system permease protein [Actinokineospora alba]
MTRARLTPAVLATALLVLVASIVVSTLLGAAGLGWTRVIREIVAQLTGGVSPLSEREAAIVWQVRFPRVLLAGLVGAALAVSGAAYQGVFRNPLADPYLLGAAAGAGMAATLVVVTAPSAAGWIIGPLPLAAFAGALGGVGLTWVLGRSAGGGTAILLLSGIAVAAFLTSIQTFAQQLNTDTIKQVYTWMLGGLNTSGWHEVLLTLPYITVSAIVLCLCGRLLDVLAVGDEEAASLGIRPGRVRVIVLLAASLATAAAVAVSGLIGFVGIVVPHVVRLLAGSSYRVVVPLSLVGGAVFLIVADQVARTIVAPAELPIGVITAFTGAPFFLLVLRMNRERVR